MFLRADHRLASVLIMISCHILRHSLCFFQHPTLLHPCVLACTEPSCGHPLWLFWGLMNPFLSGAPSRMLDFQVLAWTKMGPRSERDVSWKTIQRSVTGGLLEREKDEFRPVKQLIQSSLSITAKKNRTRYPWHLIWHSIWLTVSFFDHSVKDKSSNLGESLPNRLNNLFQVISVKPAVGKKSFRLASLDFVISMILNTLKLNHNTRLSCWKLPEISPSKCSFWKTSCAIHTPYHFLHRSLIKCWNSQATFSMKSSLTKCTYLKSTSFSLCLAYNRCSVCTRKEGKGGRTKWTGRREMRKKIHLLKSYKRWL